MKTVAKVIGYVLVAVLFLGVIGLIYKFTNGFNEDFKTFYVEYDGKQILTSDSKLKLEQGKEHRFDIKYTFDTDTSETKNYSVKIMPNVNTDTDFEYTVDGETYLYSSLTDITEAFNLTKDATSFTLNMPTGFSIETVLEKFHSGKKVIVPDGIMNKNPYLYTLVASSYNGKITYTIQFYSYPVVESVTLPDIVFVGTPEYNYNSLSHSIGYIVSGDGTNLTNISIEGPTSAIEGETVKFSVNLYDENYVISGFYIYAFGVDTKPEVVETNGSYKFTMPKCNVDIRIDLEYISTTGDKGFRLEYDSLGWGNMTMVNLICPDRVTASDTVTFTASIKSEYASEYKISRIAVRLGSGEDYIDDLNAVNGVYTFTAPDASILADEVNESYLTLMFYIIPIDMRGGE